LLRICIPAARGRSDGERGLACAWGEEFLHSVPFVKSGPDASPHRSAEAAGPRRERSSQWPSKADWFTRSPPLDRDEEQDDEEGDRDEAEAGHDGLGGRKRPRLCGMHLDLSRFDVSGAREDARSAQPGRRVHDLVVNDPLPGTELAGGRNSRGRECRVSAGLDFAHRSDSEPLAP
jgi:hypothetical protein